MPVLPLVDLMILLAWSALIIGAVQKTLSIAIGRGFYILGFTAMDFLWMAAVALLFALTLAARTWVKANEPGIRRRQHSLHTGEEVLPDFPDPRLESQGSEGRSARGDQVAAS